MQSVRTGADGGSALSAASAARSLAAVRGLHSFLDAERVSTTGDPSRLVPSPALPRRLPHPLSIDQVEALIDAAGRPGTGRDATERDAGSALEASADDPELRLFIDTTLQAPAEELSGIWALLNAAVRRLPGT